MMVRLLELLATSLNMVHYRSRGGQCDDNDARKDGIPDPHI